jgi:hypothetical protein
MDKSEQSLLTKDELLQRVEDLEYYTRIIKHGLLSDNISKTIQFLDSLKIESNNLKEELLKISEK